MNRRQALKGLFASAVALVTNPLNHLAKPQVAALTIPNMAFLPLNVYIKGERYHVMFDRMIIPTIRTLGVHDD